MELTMKTILTVLATALLFQAATAQTTASSLATTENFRTAQSLGRDIRAKKYDKAATTVLTHKEIKRRAKLNDREVALLKNPRASMTDAKKNPTAFVRKHKSSFWDRFRKTKKSSRSTAKK
jgi:hypothetical protein